MGSEKRAKLKCKIEEFCRSEVCPIRHKICLELEMTIASVVYLVGDDKTFFPFINSRKMHVL